MKFVFLILFPFLTLIAGLASTANYNIKPRKGALIWEDNFGSLNKSTWKHLITGWRGGNNEFQYYTDRPENSYARDGLLYIKPTLTADRFDEEFLYNGVLDLNDEGCNINWDGGCVVAAGTDIINPIQSARMVTEDSFSFKYGIVETRVKMPKGDWIWPAIWMMPTDNLYGGWPSSGEIDIFEVRCNEEITCNGNVPNGRQVASQTMHWGPDPNQNRARLTHYEKVNTEVDFSEDFHIFELHWTSTGMQFYIDDELVGGVDPPSGGFWELGSPFDGENPWINGTPMAPFDRRFHFIVNVAVGGNFFPDGCVTVPFRKPWIMKEPTEMTNFWEAKSEWYDQTWNAQTEDNAMKVDYIRVYELE